MPIIATAGHVDHGKSTLIQALTGRDPDRWAEEKERGLTIDLGFAWAKLGVHDVGFVDVPGHERFIKNMLAGVGAIDVALFVVAADEGWMPQSEEHLSVLDLLDTRHGVVALTRVDLADSDDIDLAELEVLEKTEGTSLADWPVIRVSPITDEGMDELRASLEDQLDQAGDPANLARPRMWIDRSFHISGAGTVVTGTLSGGTLAVDDDLVLWPSEVPVRIRGMQHHEESVESLDPGTRAALNISGAVEPDRGAMLGPPDAFGSSTSFLTELRQVRNIEERITSRGAYHFHLGSGSWPVRIRVIGESLCLVRSNSPIPMQSGDRFILREAGRRAVVAGGRVLDPHPPSSGPALREAASAVAAALDDGPDPAANAVADALLAIRGADSLARLYQDSGGGRPATQFVTATQAMADQEAAAILESILASTARFHADNRLRPGIPRAELASSLDVDPATISLVVAGSDDLVDDGSTIRQAHFAPGLTSSEEAYWQAAQARLAESLAVPRASQLGLSQELLYALIRDGQLVRIEADLVYLPNQIATIESALVDLPDEFAVADFRDRLEVTRRHAVPLLEWLDKKGVTRRNGDVRSLR
ncbi:MAG: selenocysteine-specific translation elongation factor [Acidimicrobiia bacterium]|nr:selenocysteine-specific translation elongation factor [Acidimicrobiia bacterium]